MPKNRPINREKLLEDIYILLKKIEHDSNNISRPLAELFSMVVLPFLIFPFLHSSQIIGHILVDSLHPNNIKESIIECFKKFYAGNLENQKICATDINNFEQIILLDSTKRAWANSTLEKIISPSGNLNDESSWVLPYRLNQLNSNNNVTHLLFLWAQRTDAILNQQKYENVHQDYKDIRLLFINLLNKIILCGSKYKPDSFFSESAVIAFPELKEVRINLKTFNSSTELSTMRIAEIMKDRYPDYANFNNTLEAERNDLLVGLNDIIRKVNNFVAALAISFFLKDILIRPIINRILPLNWFLTEPLVLKQDYSHMNPESLERQLIKLQRAHNELLPLANKIKKYLYSFYGIVISFIAFYLLQKDMKIDFSWNNRHFYGIDSLDIIKPLCVALFLGYVVNALGYYNIQRKDTKNIDNKITKLKNDIKYILGDASHCIDIEGFNHERLSLSILKLDFRRKHRMLTPHYLSTSFIKTLEREDGYFLPSYTETEFSLPASTFIYHREEQKKRFQNLLQSAIANYELKTQMKEIIKVLKSYITTIEQDFTLTASDSFLYKYIFKLENSPNLERILLQHGFEAREEYLYLSKDTPFSKEELINIITELKDTLPKNPYQTPVSCDDHLVQRRKQKPLESLSNTTTHSQNPKMPTATIRWPSGAFFPSANVKKVRGGINQYISWILKEVDFGDYQSSYQPFREKSEQKASGALAKTGIKVRPTIGTYKNRQRLFPAHVKIPGDKYGNQGVVLDIEKAPTGETLYITRGFEPNIHRGIK